MMKLSTLLVTLAIVSMNFSQALFSQQVSEVELFRNGDDGLVSNGGREAHFTLNRPARITYLLSYHYNDGRGVPGGKLKIVGEYNTTWGPWSVDTVNKVYWVAHPNVDLPAGRYRVVDSDPSTWSSNKGSMGQGHIIIKGIWGAAKQGKSEQKSEVTGLEASFNQNMDALVALTQELKTTQDVRKRQELTKQIHEMIELLSKMSKNIRETKQSMVRNQRG